MADKARPQPSDIKYTLLCGVASFISSFASNVFHPLEVIKTRFQSHDGNHNRQNVVPKYEGIYSAMRTIIKNEGFFGLYKGFFVNFLSQASAQVIFFTIYESRLKSLSENKQEKFMSSVAQASFQASIFSTLITQPLWVVRTRMLLTMDKFNEKDNFMHNARKLYAEYGIKGFSRGLGVSMVMSMGGLIQMYTFQGCKILFESIKHQQHDNGIMNYILNMRAFLAGGIAKLVSSLLSHPLTTIRTRYQQEQYLVDSKGPKYTGNYDIIVRIINQEGIGGFYKGFYVNLLKGFLQRGLYFYCYQLCKRVLEIERHLDVEKRN